MTFTQNNKTICFKYGQHGHGLKNCPLDKDNALAKPDWWINQPGNKEKLTNMFQTKFSLPQKMTM